MINISTSNKHNTRLLDTLAHLANPSAVGISTGPYGTIVHMPDSANPSEQSVIQTLLNQADTLAVAAVKTVMNEGDADPVITCDDARISGDAEVNYLVLLDDEVYAEGTASVVSSEATLNLVSPVAGVYDIFLYRRTGDYASGSVRITVNEV